MGIVVWVFIEDYKTFLTPVEDKVFIVLGIIYGPAEEASLFFGLDVLLPPWCPEVFHGRGCLSVELVMPKQIHCGTPEADYLQVSQLVAEQEPQDEPEPEPEPPLSPLPPIPKTENTLLTCPLPHRGHFKAMLWEELAKYSSNLEVQLLHWNSYIGIGYFYPNLSYKSRGIADVGVEHVQPLRQL